MPYTKGFDTSLTVTQSLCDAAKEKGYKFVVRYYTRNATPSYKLIRRNEAELILDNGFNLVIVYQDNNKTASDFNSALGRTVAEAAAKYASDLGQPSGSAIYFAVDYDAGPVAIKNNIVPYFQAIQDYFDQKALGYEIGVYGSGSVCSSLKEELGVSYTWLAMSTGWSGYNDYNDAVKYSLKQIKETTLANVKIDTDEAGSSGEYGGFTYLS